MTRPLTSAARRCAALVAVLAATAAGAQTTPAAARAAAPATPAVDVAGVKYPGAVEVAGQTLPLNGAGIRYKFVVKVYTAGLYLPQKTDSPEAVLGSQAPRRLHVQMLRDIDGNELGKLFARGMRDNAPREDFAKTIAGTLRMADIFSAKKKLAEGEHFSVDWVPGQGTVILLNGKRQGDPIPEPEFFSGLLSIWLGSSPADALLKDALLGRARPAGLPGQQ